MESKIQRKLAAASQSECTAAADKEAKSAYKKAVYGHRREGFTGTGRVLEILAVRAPRGVSLRVFPV